MSRTSLSLMASTLQHLHESFAEAAEMDAAFDGGEFSGPAISGALAQAVREALAASGWTAVEFEAELVARTSARYAHFSGLDSLVETAFCEVCGERRDVVAEKEYGPAFDASVALVLDCGDVAL